jgi:hypothetical protein
MIRWLIRQLEALITNTTIIASDLTVLCWCGPNAEYVSITGDHILTGKCSRCGRTYYGAAVVRGKAPR